MSGIARLALSLWIGSVASVAFLVTPRVFDFIDDNKYAGDLVAPIFNSVDLFGIGAAVLFALAARKSRWRVITVVVLGAAAAINVFGLSPRIAARDENFEVYHHIAVGLWSLILLGGVVLVVAGPRPAEKR